MIGSHSTARHPVAGALFGLASSATYAVFLLILRHASHAGRHPAGQLFDATTGAAAGALILGLTLGGLQLAIPWPSLGWLLVLTLTSGVIGWLLVTGSLPHLPAAISSLVLLLEPVGALILAAIVLGQRPSLLQLGGVALICGSVLIVATGQTRVDNARCGKDGPRDRERGDRRRSGTSAAASRRGTGTDDPP
jgi:drug/metabolite transporter (DMT)-like permease